MFSLHFRTYPTLSSQNCPSENTATEFDCRRISVNVHQSASDKLAVVHLSCLFGAESYSGQREGKSVWQGFQYKSEICELVSGKLSKCLNIHS